MSMKELKDEMKDTEGSPEVKAKIRRMQMEQFGDKEIKHPVEIVFGCLRNRVDWVDSVNLVYWVEVQSWKK